MENMKFFVLEERIVFDAALALTVSPPEGTPIIYVNGDLNQPGDGLTWETAFSSLDSALQKAQLTTGADQIWVADGTYKPSIATAVNSPLAKETFVIPTQTYVYGGFAGNEQLLSERNVSQNTTVLSGEIGDLTLKSDNAWHVVTIGSGAPTPGATVLLDGFTIRDGYGIGTGSLNDSRGAGLYTRGNVLTTLQNMTFVDNHVPLLKTVPFATSTGLGGAIYHINGALVVADSYFENNSAGATGGAIFSQNGTFVDIIGTTFKSNYTSETFHSFGRNDPIGGAIRMQNGILHVADSAFIDNYSGGAIGALAYFVSNPALSGQTVIENTLFQGNSSEYQGGALALIDITGLSNVSALIRNSDFIGNKTTLVGGGLAIDSMTATVESSRFVNNEAGGGAGLLSSNLSALFGGGTLKTTTVESSFFVGNKATGASPSVAVIDHNASGGLILPMDQGPIGGGAIVISEEARLIVRSSSFINNEAPNGGAISVQGYSVYLGPPTSYPVPAGFDLSLYTLSPLGAHLEVYDSTFTNNRATAGDGGAILSKGWQFPAMPGIPTGFPLYGETSAKIVGSTFTNNRATNVGAAVAGEHTTLQIENSAFKNNQMSGVVGSLSLIDSSYTGVNNTFKHEDTLNFSLSLVNVFTSVLDDDLLII